MTTSVAAHSRRAGRLADSALAELYVLAMQVGAIDLAVGTPSYPNTPVVLIDRARAAIANRHNQYADPRGEQRLRERIAAAFDCPTDPDSGITVTAGATEGLCAALFTTIDPGDEVVLCEPFYENFLSTVLLAGGVPRFVPLRAPDWRWDPADLAAAFGPRTRAIVLNTPANPTGRVLTADELGEVAELVQRWGVTLICDEVYSNLVFDGNAHVSAIDIPELRPHSVVIGSLSKNLAISGWRIGFVRADAERTTLLRRVHGVMTNGTAAPLQRAVGLTDIVDGDWWRPAAGLEVRRDAAQEMLRDLGMTCRPADGGCFLLADISGVTDLDSESYVRKLLAERGVLLVPGGPFFADPDRGDRYVRVAFNRPVETIRAAATRLSA